MGKRKMTRENGKERHKRQMKEIGVKRKSENKKKQ